MDDSKLDNLYKEKLNEHAHFIHDFNKDKVHYMKLISTYFLHEHCDENFFPVTTNVTFENNQFKISRLRIYKDFYNHIPDSNSSESHTGKSCSTEQITIDSDKGFLSMNDDMFKKEGVIITKDGILSKTVKFKIYSNAKQLLFLQNIYYYRNITALSGLYSSLYDRKSKISIGSDIGEVTYHDLLKNII